MTGSGPTPNPCAGARALSFALLAAFWVAQLGGLAHAISHVNAGRGVDGPAPHALLCTGCVAAAESGAAPLPSAPAQAAASFGLVEVVPPRPAVTGQAAVADYRSRAPPAAAT